MIKYFLASFLMLTISCEVKKSCTLPDYIKKRENHLNLSTEAESSLNVISRILDGSNRLIKTANAKENINVLENEVFFNFSKESQVFHFTTIYYKGYDLSEKSHYFNFDVPLNELNPENIKIMDEGLNWQDWEGECSVLEITSNFNNPQAFSFKSISYDESGKPILGQCETRSTLVLYMETSLARQFKEAFIKFLATYKV